MAIEFPQNQEIFRGEKNGGGGVDSAIYRSRAKRRSINIKKGE